MSEFEHEVARCEGFEVGVEDHGMPYMFGTFHYDGGGQGFGYAIDADFIKRFLQVFRVDRLSKVNGRHCWVTHNHSSITRVEPMLPDEGEAFDVLAWSETAKRRGQP